MVSSKCSVTVVITLYNDSRVFKTVESLSKQDRLPDKVLIADGGSPECFQESIRSHSFPSNLDVEYVVLPGRCIDTRRQVIDRLIDSTDIVVFLDSDEVVPGFWLGNLISPIVDGVADFSGGERISYITDVGALRVLNRIIYANQKYVKNDVSKIAMGNSAWHVRVFKTIGNFDMSDVRCVADDSKKGGSFHVSDDYDINIRAIRAGFRGVFVDKAWVYHDQSHINSYGKLLTYFYNNYVRTAMVYFKHHAGLVGFSRGVRRVEIVHPFQLFLLMLRPVALVHGWLEWQRIR